MDLLSVTQVAARLTVSRQSVYRLMRFNGFPAPIKIGGRSVWLAAEVDAWIQQRIEARS